MCTRFEYQQYAREAYELGVRYIGGCCGSEAQHIRGISEELAPERGGTNKKAFYSNVLFHSFTIGHRCFTVYSYVRSTPHIV